MASELVQVSGHIIDSLILPKILDDIMDLGGSFEIVELSIGKRKADPSTARLRVSAPSRQQLQVLLTRLARLGAAPVSTSDAQLVRAAKDGVFPASFYSTTNLPTFLRVHGRWLPVKRIEMDCGIVVRLASLAHHDPERDRRSSRRVVVDPDAREALCTPMLRIRTGDLVVCGHAGIRVKPLERSRRREVFQFMNSAVSPEKPKAQLIAQVAAAMRAMKRWRRKILVVAGPVVIHTGGGAALEQLIRHGYVQALFGGNGLATHDIESALYGTALGVYLDRGVPARDGHDHHMRAINTIRDCGGIAQAVRRGILKRGIMHACITRKVPYVLAGSVRDDGPLPDVITDVIEAQEAMRRHIPGVGLALMISSTLHAIATGNMLPATVKTICVDINPAVVTKLSDRGTFQGIGIISDAASFLRELCAALRL